MKIDWVTFCARSSLSRAILSLTLCLTGMKTTNTMKGMKTVAQKSYLTWTVVELADFKCDMPVTRI